MTNYDKKKEESFHDGARKAALLLSILEPDVVEKLLALFDPNIVDIIVDEAKRVQVEQISPDEVELIVNEFLTSFGVDDRELASVLLGEAKRTLGERLRSERSRYSGTSDEKAPNEQVPVSSLDVFDPDSLVQTLKGERPTVIASVLSLISPTRGRQTMKLLATDSSSSFDNGSLAVVENSLTYLTPSSAMKRLESVFFEHMLEK